MTKLPPRENDWFRDESGRVMQVILFDEDDGVVEVQLFEGEITEFDLQSWYELDLEPIEPPEDWSGPFDDLIEDDMGDTEKPMRPTDWDGPMDAIDLED